MERESTGGVPCGLSHILKISLRLEVTHENRDGNLRCVWNLDMNAPMDDANFLKAITTEASLETVFYTKGGGLSVTLKKR